jgi:hypothetical protein
MYTAEVNIGEMRDRPVFENWSYLQDAGGGSYKRLDNSFYLWAKVEDGSGIPGQSSGRQLEVGASQSWQYDLRITVRNNSLIRSQSTVIWKNARYTILAITLTNDRFQVIRCSKMDGNLADPSIINPIAMAYVFNFTASGGETGFTNTSIISKTIIGAYKDGIAYKVIYTGTPQPKEVLYVSSTGQFVFGDPFFDDEVSIIQYI